MKSQCRICGVVHNDQQGFARDLCNHCLFLLYPGEYRGDLPTLDALNREIEVLKAGRSGE